MDLPGDEQIRTDLFGPGYLSDDLSQSTADRIVERILPYLTPKWLRIDQLIPVLEKRNFVPRDSLSVLKDSKDQTWMFTEIVRENGTSSFLFSLYASLVDSGRIIPLHYRLANEIKAIIQSECRIDGSVGSVKKTIQSAVVNHSPNNSRDLSRPETVGSTRSPNNSRELSVQSQFGRDRSVGKTMQPQPAVVNRFSNNSRDLSRSEAAVATPSPNNTGELSGTDEHQLTDILCSRPYEASRSPNSTGVQNGSTLPHHKEIVPGNNLPPVPKNTSRDAPISQLNDLGPSSSVYQNSFNVASVVPPQNQFSAAPLVPLQNQFSAASVVPPQNQFSAAPLVPLQNQFSAASVVPPQNQFSAASVVPPQDQFSPIEFCDPSLLEAFNDPNDLDLFSCLVQTGAAVNLPTHEGSYLLHLAVSGGMDEKIKLLLHHGAATNVVRATDGKTPLHLACERQSIGYVKRLIERGADVNALDHNGMSCLHSTNTLQQPEIVDLLLNHGAHCDIPTKGDYLTPLVIAAGLSSNTVKQSISHLLKGGASVNGVDQSTERPLVAAAFTGTMETVKELINNRANVNIRNKDGMTPLIAAVHTNKKQIVQLLLDRGADMNCIRSGSYTISGNIVLMSGTALCEAAYNGQLDVVKMLREKGALMTAKSQEEKAPIVFAVIGGHAEVVDYICTGTKLPDNELLEAFVTALELGHNDCAVIVFMKSGGLKDKMMEEARRHGSREIVELLSRISDSAVQGTSPASSEDTNSSLLEAPRRATLNMAGTPSQLESSLFQPVEALPPPRPTFHHESVDGLDFNEGHRQTMIEILLEFAQICLKAALDYKDCKWLIDHANKCHHPHVAQFFRDYYSLGGTMMVGRRLLENFFQGEPSTMNFLINKSIVTKARVEKVLNEMGRNHREFFTELMKAFHQFPGTDHLPYDGDLLASHLFNGTIVMGQRYKPSTVPFSSDLPEHQPTMPSVGEAKKIYEEAMKRGSVEMSIIKCLVLGIAGVGKTHLKWLLLPEELINRPAGRVSTGLADNPIQAFVGSVESIIAGAYDDDPGKWEVLDEAKLLQVLARAYQVEKPSPSSDSLGMKVAPQLAQTDLPKVQGNADSEHDDMVIANTVSEVEVATLPPIDQYALHMETEANNNPVADKVDGLFINAFKNLIDKKVLNVKMNLVQFIDSGGQPQFVELLPAFVQDVSAILFVVNLSEQLDHCPMIYFYGQDCKPVGKPYVSPSSHKQVLEQCVRAAYARDENPQVFIVGSHKDKEDECSETRKTKNAVVRRAVNNKSLVKKTGTQVIFDINCKNPDGYDKKIATRLRRAIVHHCGGKKKYFLPIKWFVLEMLIKHTAVQNILSFTKCLELANRLGMDEQDLEAALLHMVKYNLLLWYHKIMREIVFCDPQVILKIITDLVQCKHELDQEDVSDISPEGLSSAAVKEVWCTKFRDRALINCDFLSHPHFQKRFVDGVFTAEHFIKLMCHLYIGVHLGDDCLMPALLDPLSSEDICKISKEHRVAEPLLIHFLNKFIPYGMFTCLVAFIQASGEFSLAELDGVPTQLCRNCASFKCTKIPAKFTIIDSSTYIEVHLHSGKDHQACPRIRKRIHEGIEKCAQILNYSMLKNLKYGFFCKYCHNSVAQPYEESPTKAQCIRGCNDMDLTSLHTVWITEEGKDEFQSSITSCLGENDLFDVQEEVCDLASKWNALGLALRLQKSSLDTIQSKYPHDPCLCLTEMLQSWLRQNYDVSKYGAPSWKLLCSAIEAKAGGNNPALAANIRSRRTQ